MSITNEELRRLLSYDESTGVFTWMVRVSQNRGRIGDVAGTSNQYSGYVHIKISYKMYKAHRLAWQYVHGVEPPNEIDHINGIKDDNRIVNIRPCDRYSNCQNSFKKSTNSSGFKGVSLDRKGGKFKASIMNYGRRMHLGYFDSAEIAAIVYDITALELFGKFAKTNF